MNSVVQIFINCPEIVDFCLNENFLEYAINYRSKFGFSGYVTRAFYRLLNIKWKICDKLIIPNDFKRMLGLLSPNFANTNQHDASEFYSTVISALHDDTNMITVKPNYDDPSTILPGLEEVAAQLSLANYYRREFSFISSLFVSLMVNRLSCPSGHQRTKYEVVNTLPVVISNNTDIYVQVKLYRFPDLKDRFVESETESNELELAKRQSALLNSTATDSSSKAKEIFSENLDKLINSTNAREIPILLTIVLKKGDTFGKVIETLLKIKELSTIENRRYLIFNYNRYMFFQTHMKLDDYLSSNDEISVFEVVNPNQLNSFFNIKSNEKIFDIEIQARTFSFRPEFFCRRVTYQDFLPDRKVFLPVSKHNQYNCMKLYLLVFNIYSYIFVDSKRVLNQLSTAKCRPFTLKVVNKYTKLCVKCMKITFCQGCSLPMDPDEFVQLSVDDIIVMDFCSRALAEEVDMSSVNLFVTHSSHTFDKSSDIEYQLSTCLNEMSKKHLLDDKLYCSKCKEERPMEMESRVAVPSKYFSIVLLRFRVNNLSCFKQQFVKD